MEIIFNSFFNSNQFHFIYTFCLLSTKVYQAIFAIDFYSIVIIKNLKRVGNIFVYIGISTILFRALLILYFQSIITIEGYTGLAKITTLVSSIEITTVFLIVIGLFFLLFSNAFENARNLKQENDLTI